MSKFTLGLVAMSIGVSQWIELNSHIYPLILECLGRHHAGDWGNICNEDKALNDEALQVGNRVLSSYTVADQDIWIITEADRSVTTILFPDEY